MKIIKFCCEQYELQNFFQLIWSILDITYDYIIFNGVS